MRITKTSRSAATRCWTCSGSDMDGDNIPKGHLWRFYLTDGTWFEACSACWTLAKFRDILEHFEDSD